MTDQPDTARRYSGRRDWSGVKLEPAGKENQFYFVDGDFKSLPLRVVEGRAVGDIPAYSYGDLRIFFRDPDYKCDVGNDPAATVAIVAVNPHHGIEIAKNWLRHAHVFEYYIQFETDDTRQKIHALSRHTEIVSLISDCLLSIDTAVLWRIFDALMLVESAYDKHRKDESRDTNYEKHVNTLKMAWKGLEDNAFEAQRVVERITRTLEAWQSLGPVLKAGKPSEKQNESHPPVKVFLSYAHEDESYRDELNKHCAILKREGSIALWTDKCIIPGQEWEDEIVKAMMKSDIMFLLVSPDFLHSDFCMTREFGLALDRHEKGQMVIIPIFVRFCDWKSTPILKFQGLPTGARPVKSWSDTDEAFDNVVQGIRKAIQEWRSRD